MEKNLPKVSVVIPAFNEEKYIGLCLESVQDLNYPSDLLEIIVIDNGSTDRTVEIASSFGVQVYIWPQVRVGAVRNYGVSKSTGNVIAFLDGDCIPPKDWLVNALRFMDENSVDVVGGTYLLRSNPSWVESAWVISSQLEDKKSTILVGGSIVIKRITFLDVGGFDESLNAGEDSALGEALTKKGYTIYLLKCCAVVHLGYPRTISNFTRRQYWHASSYLKSRKTGRLDIIFLMAIIFSFSLFFNFWTYYFFNNERSREVWVV